MTPVDFARNVRRSGSLLATLDSVRFYLLRLGVAHVPGVRTLLASRDLRIILYAALGVMLGATCSVLAPVWLFLWAPLILGVPHLLADLRYLVFDPLARARLGRADALGGMLLIGALISSTPAVGCSAVLAWVLLTPALRRGKPHVGRLVLTGVMCAAAIWLSLLHPIFTAYALVHAHNLVALWLFGAMFRYQRITWLMLGGAAVMTGAILLGVFDTLSDHRAALEALSYNLVPPALAQSWNPVYNARIVVAFVFVQGMHYTVWLRLVPEAARPREGVRGFASSARALKADMGALTLWATAGLGLGLIGYGLSTGAYAARGTYLQIAGFHAYLELAVLARWWCMKDARA